MANFFTKGIQALFGYKFPTEDHDDDLQTFSPKVDSDGALEVAPNVTAASYVDYSGGSLLNEVDLINKYREMALQPEIDEAVEQICNEAIISEDGKKTVEIILDELDLDDTRKKKLEDQFNKVLKLLEFHNRAYDVFRRWYIDGRLYYHAVIDPKNPGKGIQEMRYIDPRQIRKVKVTAKKRDKEVPTVVVSKTVEEFFVYSLTKATSAKTISPYATRTAQNAGIKIAKDSIVYVTSGLTDVDGTLVLGWLHKAIKFLNVLRAVEDATVIHRIARAPDRRVFYIDVGELPRAKVDQYIRDIATKHKNKLSYDSATGEVRDERKFVTAIEDYYFPRREGKGTDITNLNGLSNAGNIDDVEYFGKKLMKSLGVPVSRLDPENAFNIGRSSQISRDEILFARFIDRLRNRFSALLLDTLGKQLILTNFCNTDEWEEIKGDIRLRYLRDVLVDELKDQEIFMERMNAVNLAATYVGRFFSNKWVRQNLLRQTDKDIETIDNDIQEELTNPQYHPPIQSPDQGGDDEEGGEQPDPNGMDMPPPVDDPFPDGSPTAEPQQQGQPAPAGKPKINK